MMVELMLSVFILGTSLITFVQIISKTYADRNNKTDIVIATNLAQEGVELVRNIRDANWLATPPINGFDGWTTNSKKIQYDDKNSNMPMNSNSPGCPGTRGCALTINNDGFYATSGGGPVASKFSRQIDISANGNTMTVTSTIWWQDQLGAWRHVVAASSLTNWGDK